MKSAAASKSVEGRAAAEGAANEVVEAELDTVVAMGWAHIQKFCLDNMKQVRALLCLWMTSTSPRIYCF
jgi:hypothetical protein